jgi:hypothetical protein
MTKEYLFSMPKVVPVGKALVHNQVRPTRQIGMRGFRFWLAAPDTPTLEACDCKWAPELGPHFRVKVTRVALACIAALLASASTVAAQTSTVFTNIVDGRAYRQSIVRVERPAQPAAPVPPSITTTPVLPKNYQPPLSASSYVPPTRSNWGETRVSRPVKTEQPMFINGYYVGAAPSGNWTSTVVGRPIVDVNVIGTPRRSR